MQIQLKQRTSMFARIYEGLPLIEEGRNKGFVDRKAAAVLLNLTEDEYDKALSVVKGMYGRQPNSTITLIEYIKMLNQANLTINDTGCNSMQASRLNDDGAYHFEQFEFSDHIENKQTRDKRMSTGEFYNQKKVYTPAGVFESIKDAADRHEIDYRTVVNRIESIDPKFDDWYFEDEISSKLIKMLQRDGIPFFANSNVSKVLTPVRFEKLKKEASRKFEDILRCLLIDIDNDPNSNETGERLARMYFDEIMSGRYEPQPKVTAFPNEGKNKYDGMLVVRSEIRSICSHHHQPVVGVCYIGVLPSDLVIGLSKYSRIAQWCARRGTLQEELTTEIADLIMEVTDSESVAVHITATHGCCENRGIMATSSLTQTTVLRGNFFTKPGVKEEFFENVKMQQQIAPR